MICVPIVAKSTEEASARMVQGARLADILELRIDQIRDVDLKQLMSRKPDGKAIMVTNRRADEGGGFVGTERERIDLLKDAVAFGADYVDAEARTETPLLKELVAQIAQHGSRTKWIISHHDLKETPSAEVLRKRFNAFSRTKADIVKICTYAHTMEDNLRVLGLIPYARNKGRTVIALCMGEQGRISRIMAPFLGSHLIYASLEKGAESAPGQLTIEEMRLIAKMVDAGGTEEG